MINCQMYRMFHIALSFILNCINKLLQPRKGANQTCVKLRNLEELPHLVILVEGIQIKTKIYKSQLLKLLTV